MVRLQQKLEVKMKVIVLCLFAISAGKFVFILSLFYSYFCFVIIFISIIDSFIPVLAAPTSNNDDNYWDYCNLSLSEICEEPT